MNERKAGVLLNYVNLALRLVSNFWVMRLVIMTLGDAEYGLLSLSASVLIMLPLLDLGMSPTIARYTAEYNARNDRQGLLNFLGVAQRMFYFAALIAAISCTCMYFYLPEMLPKQSSDPETFNKIQWMFIMLSAGSVLNFTRCIYPTILAAFEKFVVTNLLVTFSVVFGAVGSVLFVLNGAGAIGVTAVGLLFQLVSMFPARWYCRKKLKVIPNIRYWDWSLFKKSFSYSTWIFVGSICGLAGDSLVPYIIGLSCGEVEITTHRVGTMVVSYFSSACVTSHVFYPRVVQMVTNNVSREQLTALLVRVGRIDFLIAMLFVGGFVVLGHQFLELWTPGTGRERSWYAGLIAMTTFPMFSSLGVGMLVFFARNLVKFKLLANLGCTVLGTIVGYIFVWKYGLFGLMIPRMVISGFLFGIILIVYLHRVGGLDMIVFMKKTYTTPLLPAILAGLGAWGYISYFPIESWIDFILSGFLYTILYILIGWVVVLNSEEKNMVGVIVGKVLNKFGDKRKTVSPTDHIDQQ